MRGFTGREHIMLWPNLSEALGATVEQKDGIPCIGVKWDNSFACFRLALTDRQRPSFPYLAPVACLKLGDVQVSRFSTETVLAHVRERKAAGIANATINRELDIIRGVLKKAKRWHLFADEIKPLPLRQSVGRALSYEGKLKLLKTAALRPDWQNAAWAATLALNTTMRGHRPIPERLQVRERSSSGPGRIFASSPHSSDNAATGISSRRSADG